MFNGSIGDLARNTVSGFEGKVVGTRFDPMTGHTRYQLRKVITAGGGGQSSISIVDWFNDSVLEPISAEHSDPLNLATR